MTLRGSTALYRLMVVACLTTGTDVFLIALPPYLLKAGFSQSAIGWFLSLSMPALILSQPFWGYKADAHSYTWVLRWGAFLNFVALALYVLGTYLPSLFWPGRLFQWVGLGGIGIGMSACGISQAETGKKGHAAGVLTVPALVVMGIAPALGTWAIQYGGARELLLLALLCAGIIFFVSFYVSDRKQNRPAHERDANVRSAVLELFSNSRIRPALGLSFAMGLCYMCWATLLSQMVKKPEYFTGFVLAFGFSAAFARSILNAWFVRHGKLRIPAALMLFSVIGLAIIPHLTTFYSFVSIGLSIGIGYGLVYPTLVETLTKETGESRIGRTLSLAAIMGCLGTLTGGPGCGWIAAAYGFQAAFYFSAVCVGAIAAWFLLYHTLGHRID